MHDLSQNKLILSYFYVQFHIEQFLDRFDKKSGGWMDAWMGVGAVLRIAYNNKKSWGNA